LIGDGRGAGLAALRRPRALAAAAAGGIGRVISAIVSDTRRVLNWSVREVIVAVGSVAFIIWAFKLLNNDHLYAPLGFDEQYFVWTGWSVLKGLIPYRDFSEWKGPVVFLVHALALKLHGFRDLHFRWFFLYFPLVSLIALYMAMLTRKIDKLCALALIIAIIHLFVGLQFHEAALSDSESIGLTCYFFGVACLIARTRLGDKLKAVGVGLLACCMFSKEAFAPSVFFTWLTCFLLDTQMSTLRVDAKRYFKLTLIGGGSVLVALCLYLVPTGGMTYYVRLMRSYVRIYKDPQHSYCVMFGRFTPTDAINDLRHQWQQIRTDFMNLTVLGYLIPFAALFVLFVPRRSILLALAALLALVAGLWAVTATKCQWFHYYVMPMAGLFLCMILGLDAMTRRLASARVTRLAGWLLLAGVLVAVAPRLDKETSRRDKRSFANAYEEATPGSLAYIAANTKPGDRIFTTGPPGIYVQADRLHSTRESGHLDAVIYGYPGNTDEERFSDLKAQLEKHMPKVVVVDELFEAQRQKHMSLLVTPFLQAHGYKKEGGGRLWLRPN
jgi:hypothetical protein